MKDIDLLNFSTLADDGGDFIPLFSSEDEDIMNKEATPEKLPILPIRNTTLFPGVVIPITVGRDKSIKLVQEANAGNKTIGVVSQKDENIEDPLPEHINAIGTVARIIKLLRMPDGSTTIIIQGKKRIEITEFISDTPYYLAKTIDKNDLPYNEKSKKFIALINSIKDLALKIIKIAPDIPTEASVAINNIESPSFLIHFIASNMNIPAKEKQLILEELDINKRSTQILKLLTRELQMLQLKNDIQSKVKVDIDQQQREYFLHQQMKTIQEELGGNPIDQEIEEYKNRAKHKKWNKDVNAQFDKELAKLQRMNPAGVEYSVQSNYLDVLLDLPWNEKTKDRFDLPKAKKILDRDHYGLDDVKERILEHLAVIKLKGDLKSPIICLDGPPGVGKTSLGKSIAEALNRKYIRMSLGGLRDEAEIRGHRKTYIGAMPGRIIQSLKKAQSSNPVFILDEIDKVGRDHHGDPSSALLEVLDPEQNSSFYDNFVEMDFDLSEVLFIATSNNINSIHPALKDRLEIIHVSGYTVEEKIEIAKKHLIPKQLRAHGIDAEQVKFSKSIIEAIIEEYTRESGVRALDKKLAKVVRQIAKKVVMEEEFNPKLSLQDLHKILGPGHSKEKYENNDVAGVVTGLAWTAFGGDILFIESSLSAGKGKLTLTGNLGDVMKESAVIAMEYLKSKASIFDINTDNFDKWNVHIHVPEGATPKDGPSAGITIFTALLSLFKQQKVKKNMAMTGEITLRGKILPVGGIKEKILAAKRAKIKEIILSKENEKDVLEINQNYLQGLIFHYVDEMTEVAELALTNEKVKNPVTLAGANSTLNN